MWKPKYIRETQSAYRKHHCTTENHIKLTQHVSEAFQWSEMVDFVCLDVEKAFDAVWRLRLVPKLNWIGLKNSVIWWINSFSLQRNVFVKITSTVSDSFSPTAGVLQGSIIAPILFVIYVSGLPLIKAQISKLADDFAIYYRSQSPKLIEKHLQLSLNSLINWCDSLKIKINPNKTHCLIFKNPSKKESSLELNIKRIYIQNTQLTKFLVIILTPHLKWNEHCKDLIRRANSRLFQLWRLSNLNVNEESLILVYKSWIRPLFLYSNACWLDQSQTLIKKIQKFQNRALRTCLRKARWYQTQNLHDEANMKSVREMQMQLANGYIQWAIKHNILYVSELIYKKRQCPLNSCKSTLDHLNY